MTKCFAYLKGNAR